jgi:EpsI family protein
MKPPANVGRFWVVACLLAGMGALLQARQAGERVPRGEPLSSFPVQIGEWRGQDQVIPPDVLSVLGPGDFLSRTYRAYGQLPIDFFVAYFPSQRTGDTIHSPKNCLPGSGWTPLESSRITITSANGASVSANRYLIEKGSDRQLVIYWYQAHGRAVASEYLAKFYLVADAIRMNRSDGSLVRVVTPIGNGEDPASAEKRAVGFAEKIVPMSNRYIPL